MKKDVLKLKILASAFVVVFIFIMLVSGSGHHSAANVAQDISIEGLSLNSSAKDIESYIDSQDPPLRCSHQDIEEKEIHNELRPRFRRWRCTPDNTINSPRLTVMMSGETITAIEFSARYDTSEKVDKFEKYIRTVHDKFENQGISFDKGSNKNYGTYLNQEKPNTTTQKLYVSVAPDCEKHPVLYNVSLTALKNMNNEIYSTNAIIHSVDQRGECQKNNS